MKNFERFNDSTHAILAWADEVYDIANPRADYELEEEDDWEVATFLWHEVFGKDQLLDFMDWLWEEATNAKEKKD